MAAADFAVAEVTQPSLGVGYELAVLSQRRVPTLALYASDRAATGVTLSAMVRGDPHLQVCLGPTLYAWRYVKVQYKMNPGISACYCRQEHAQRRGARRPPPAGTFTRVVVAIMVAYCSSGTWKNRTRRGTFMGAHVCAITNGRHAQRRGARRSTLAGTLSLVLLYSCMNRVM
jgi:hypothetical protein